MDREKGRQLFQGRPDIPASLDILTRAQELSEAESRALLDILHLSKGERHSKLRKVCTVRSRWKLPTSASLQGGSLHSTESGAAETCRHRARRRLAVTPPRSLLTLNIPHQDIPQMPMTPSILRPVGQGQSPHRLSPSCHSGASGHGGWTSPSTALLGTAGASACLGQAAYDAHVPEATWPLTHSICIKDVPQVCPWTKACPQEPGTSEPESSAPDPQ